MQTLRPLSADFTTRKAVNYSPFRTFNRDTEVVTKANIKQDMDLLVAGGFNLIRLFDSSDMVARQTLEVIRDNTLPIKVQLGAYLQGYGNSKSSANDAEAARCIALANQFSALVVAVSVGNFTPGAIAYQLRVPAGAASVIQLASTVVVLSAIVVAARMARPEASYLVAVIASQLLSPVLWDHYALLLLLPVAYLCAAGRWWALAIPLITATPLIAITPPIAYPLSFAVALGATLRVGIRARQPVVVR